MFYKIFCKAEFIANEHNRLFEKEFKKLLRVSFLGQFFQSVLRVLVKISIILIKISQFPFVFVLFIFPVKNYKDPNTKGYHIPMIQKYDIIPV